MAVAISSLLMTSKMRRTTSSINELDNICRLVSISFLVLSYFFSLPIRLGQCGVFDIFTQCSAAWQGARGERLTVAIMLPGRQDADDWPNFMLSQWPTFTTRGTLTEEVSEQVFSKERRRLQAKHLWMEVKLRRRVLADRMYVKAPTGKSKSKEELDALLFDRAARRNRTDPYEEKSYRGNGIKEVLFFLDNAALVATTVAVMKIC